MLPIVHIADPLRTLLTKTDPRLNSSKSNTYFAAAWSSGWRHPRCFRSKVVYAQSHSLIAADQMRH